MIDRKLCVCNMRGGKHFPSSWGEVVPSQELPVLPAPPLITLLGFMFWFLGKLWREAAWSEAYHFVLALRFSDLLLDSKHLCCLVV